MSVQILGITPASGGQLVKSFLTHGTPGHTSADTCTVYRGLHVYTYVYIFTDVREYGFVSDYAVLHVCVVCLLPRLQPSRIVYVSCHPATQVSAERLPHQTAAFETPACPRTLHGLGDQQSTCAPPFCFALFFLRLPHSLLRLVSWSSSLRIGSSCGWSLIHACIRERVASDRWRSACVLHGDGVF